jgi:hypothetical protein
MEVLRRALVVMSWSMEYDCASAILVNNTEVNKGHFDPDLGKTRLTLYTHISSRPISDPVSQKIKENNEIDVYFTVSVKYWYRRLR